MLVFEDIMLLAPTGVTNTLSLLDGMVILPSCHGKGMRQQIKKVLSDNIWFL